MKRLGQLKDVSDDITMKMEVIKEENAEIRSSIQVAKTESIPGIHDFNHENLV